VLTPRLSQAASPIRGRGRLLLSTQLDPRAIAARRCRAAPIAWTYARASACFGSSALVAPVHVGRRLPCGCSGRLIRDAASPKPAHELSDRAASHWQTGAVAGGLRFHLPCARGDRAAPGGARAGQHVQHALRLLANTSRSSAVVVIATGAPPSPSRPTTRSRQPCPQGATPRTAQTRAAPLRGVHDRPLVLAPPTSSPITGIIRAS
jgi:hypothetical protein